MDEDHTNRELAVADIKVPINTIRHSEMTDKIDIALAAAQGDFPAIEKKRVADTGKFIYHYADIADVLDAVRPVLSHHKIAYIQPPRLDGTRMILDTRIMHQSQWYECSWPLASIEGALSQQTIGASLTYARRYSLCALIGVAAEDDIDSGEVADNETPKKSDAKTKPKGEVVRNPKDQLAGTKALPPRVNTKPGNGERSPHAPPENLKELADWGVPRIKELSNGNDLNNFWDDVILPILDSGKVTKTVEEALTKALDQKMAELG